MAREVVILSNEQGQQNLYRDWYLDNTSLPVPEESEIPPRDDEDEDGYSKTALDEAIEENEFQSPSEYYNKIGGLSSSNELTDQGYYKTQESGNDSIKWFWSEDLKNWCSYIVYTEKTDELSDGINQFILTVWNGKNGWIRIPNLFIFNKDESDVSGSDDLYNIKKMQNAIIKKLVDGKKRGSRKNIISMKRGASHSISKEFTRVIHHHSITFQDIDSVTKNTPDEIYTNMLARIKLAYKNHEVADEDTCFNYLGYLQIVNGYKLQKNYNYTINESGDFQTKRWSSIACNMTENIGVAGFYAQSNARFGITTNVPTLYRLPTGELCLCAHLYYAADPGYGYLYKKDPNYGFRKHYYHEYFKACEINETRMMGNDNYKAAEWINQQCAAFFGEGNEKTIASDWLRITYKKTDEITNGSIITNLLDSSKVFEQHNINKENDLKCTFTINRPVVTSEERSASDYVKKW